MKKRYREWCENNKEVSVFMQPWFLDIVAPNWDVILSLNKLGEIQGVWPYALVKKRGFSMISMPPYTQLLGPTVLFPSHITSNYKKTSFYNKVVQELESKLPKYDHLNINFDSKEGTWFPLFTLAYKQSTRYSYVINKEISINSLLSDLKPQLRNSLKQPCALGEIAETKNTEKFLSLLERSFSENKIDNFFHKGIIKELMKEAIKRNQGIIYAFPKMEAGIFLLRDMKTSYLLFTATSEEGKVSEGVAHLIWKAINESLVEGKDFDFEGSMLEGVERYFRSFGGNQKPYHQISKTNSNLLKLYKFLMP